MEQVPGWWRSTWYRKWVVRLMWKSALRIEEDVVWRVDFQVSRNAPDAAKGSLLDPLLYFFDFVIFTRNCEGDWPVIFLKTRLNWESD